MALNHLGAYFPKNLSFKIISDDKYNVNLRRVFTKLIIN
jgi:hypothetical protein